MQDRIRLYVDGELPPAESAALERELAGNPDLQSRVQFELHLQHRVKAVLQAEADDVRAPAALHDAIAGAMAADAGMVEPVTIGRAGSMQASRETVEGASRTQPQRLRRPSWFAEPRRANFFAVAACLALVAGAVLFGIFAPQISSVRLDQPQTTPIDLTQTAAPYAAEEHSRCASDAKVQKRKLEFTDAAEAESALSEHLGARVVVPSFSALGYEFIGAGRCAVPVDEPSAHAFYRSTGSGERRPCLSVFIFADRGQFMLKEHGQDVPLATGRPCESGCDGGRKSKRSRLVKVYSDGELVYLISCCDQARLEGAVQLVEDALAAARR